MNRFLLLFATLMAMFVVGCRNENPAPTPEQPKGDFVIEISSITRGSVWPGKSRLGSGAALPLSLGLPGGVLTPYMQSSESLVLRQQRWW